MTVCSLILNNSTTLCC